MLFESEMHNEQKAKAFLLMVLCVCRIILKHIGHAKVLQKHPLFCPLWFFLLIDGGTDDNHAVKAFFGN